MPGIPSKDASFVRETPRNYALTLELNVVADNQSAIRLYEKMGFVEYGRNPKGFCSRRSGYQELIYMCLDLEGWVFSSVFVDFVV